MQKDQIETALRAMGIQPMGYTGQWVQARCPFTEKHSKGVDKNPSFGVSEGSPSKYNCFTCHSKGVFRDLPKHVAMDGAVRDSLLEELTVQEASGMAVPIESVESTEEIPELPEEVYGTLFPRVGSDPVAAAYCENRDVDLATADRLGLGVWPEEGYIMFPVRGSDGRLYGWTGRAYREDVKPKVWNTVGLDKSCHLLGSEHLKPDRPVLLLEGLFAMAAFYSFGVDEECLVNVQAIMGSNLSEAQANLLAEFGEEVIFFLDGDKAGKLGTFGNEKQEGGLQTMVRACKTSYVTYPPRVIDPDDLDVDTIYDMVDNRTTFVRQRKRAYRD